EDNKNILIADTAEAFAQAVIRILKNPTLAQQLGQNGRQTVLDKYDWQVTYSAWDEVYNKLMMVER
ncbi:MAG: glycosyl transferase family 1, partial [Anaerolineae bacterium]|nr:glycosyl transferase family 1 [Anaerolineae bacterium]